MLSAVSAVVLMVPAGLGAAEVDATVADILRSKTGFRILHRANFGPHEFEVRSTYIYRCSPSFLELAHVAQKSLVTVVYKFCRKYELTFNKPNTAFNVVLLSSESEFNQLFDLPKGSAGFYDDISNTAVVYEKSSVPELPRELERLFAFTVISHEFVHQLLHNVGVQQRLSHWPSWMSEGLAEYLSAAAAMSQGGRAEAATFAHLHPARLWQLRKIYPIDEDKKDQRASLDGQRLREVITAAKLSADDYAIAWGLVHYLAECRSEKFGTLLRELTKLGELEGVTARGGEPVAANVEQFAQYFGNDFAALERALIGHLAQLEGAPRADNTVHFVATVEYGVYFIRTRNLERYHLARVFASKDAANEWILERETAIRDYASNQKLVRGLARRVLAFETQSDAEAYWRNFLMTHQRR